MSEVPKPGMTLVRTRPCGVCGARGVVEADAAGVAAWRSGVLVQEALPDLDVDDREQLVSGTHPACWAELSMI